MKSLLQTYLALNFIEGLGPAAIRRFEKKYSDIKILWNFSRQDFIEIGWKESQINQWLNLPWARIEASEQWALQENCHLIHWHDARYPRLLKEISNPPVMLYVKGDWSVLHQEQIALVGTRHPTPYGEKNAIKLSADLVDAGFCITSGLAIGIDGIAHQEVVRKNGLTIAVVATGLDRVYPVRHKNLALQIQEKGAIVSEFPLNTPPKAEYFPRRNRIISGLSRGVLVIEAAVKSGSLITARCALEQNRDIFAVPGNIENSQAAGCHALLREGAILVESVADILKEWGRVFENFENKEKQFKKNLNKKAEINSNFILPFEQNKEKNILVYLNTSVPIQLEELIIQSKLPPDIVLNELLMLELQDLVKKVPGGAYFKC